MSNFVFQANTNRQSQARLARRLGGHTGQLLIILGIILVTVGLILVITRIGHAGIPWGLAIILLMFGIWWRNELSMMPSIPIGSSRQLDLLLPADILAGWLPGLNRNEFWLLLASSWQARFIIMRLNLPLNKIIPADTLPNYDQIWDSAISMVQAAGFKYLDSAAILIGWLDSDEVFKPALVEAKLSHDDLIRMVGWVSRLQRFEHQEKFTEVLPAIGLSDMRHCCLVTAKTLASR
jgi:hypothetical protein